MEIQRLLTNIVTTDLEASKQFYTTLFSLNVSYDSDWFVHLVSLESKLELGLVNQDHDIVPAQVKSKVSGMYLTFVVEDVEAVYTALQSLTYEILQTPESTFYGQKRMLVLAPEGTVCDVSSPT
ncbi:VOC family protein [Agaribacter marinus]|uniref:Glyoxalase n=1 Tax=Agaribacter marinus TaxID=1431249 RepID=A0AA37T0K6_9ALTE|nr:VOC family protein [Agaribacter marinus]GLR72622.1 glyoxalase [Agaribacter marinus]